MEAILDVARRDLKRSDIMLMRTIVGLWMVVAALVPVRLMAQDYSAAGRHEVQVIDGTWTDGARAGREVPYRIYLPKDADASPVVIMSHGLGGNCRTYEYFGRHLASNGFACVHLQHHGSDTDAIRDAMKDGKGFMDAMRESAGNLKNAIDRPKDVSFAIDQLTAMDDLKGKIDLKRIAVAGHSFGGYTAMAIAGQGRQKVAAILRDERVSAAIAMSAPAPKRGATWGSVDIPVLAMTGTLDDSPILGGTAQSRRDAFEQLSKAPRYLVVFEGGDHMIFSGSPDAMSRAALGLPGMNGDRSRDKEFQTYIQALSLAFLDRYLRGDEKAGRWLAEEGGAKKMLAKMGEWRALER